jgi:NAD(P)H dehydrogenase (quinone)
MNVNATATDQIKSDRSTKTILVTGAAGDTGRPTVKLLLERGHKVKALVRKDDERARTLRDQGADVVVGDMLDISSMRKAADGVSSAYFVYPMPIDWRSSNPELRQKTLAATRSGTWCVETA